MIPLWWSVALAATGILGIWLAGRKNLWGWVIGIVAQILWIGYAIVTEQWGFIASALAYAAVYAVNWRRWAREGRKGVRIAPAAAAPYQLGSFYPRHGVRWTGRSWQPVPPKGPTPTSVVVREGKHWVAYD